MRIKAEFEMSTDCLTKDYRRIFMALIKNIFYRYEPVLYHALYGTTTEKVKVNKPFTFQVRFPYFSRFENNKMICGNKVQLYFSTSDNELSIALYNGLLKQKCISIGEEKPILFKLNHLTLLSNQAIKVNKLLFRTLSPILVNIEDSNVYLTPSNIGFSNAFNRIIINHVNYFHIPCMPEMINFEITKMKKITLSHYNQTMTSWLGEFVLEAPADVLQLVYDTGIGVRRSQGFGMLEIVKTY